MNTTLIGSSIAVLGLVALLGGSYISGYNKGNRLEKAITAQYEANQAILTGYTNTLAEAAQIPTMQKDDLKEVVTAALDARYGEEGSQAVFQFIQESNPQIDSTVYVQLQRLIESGRRDFTQAQVMLVDKVRVYEAALGTFWGGTWMGIAGYPSIDLDDYEIVVNQRTLDAFESGIEEPMKLR